ncbi:MAG TPA: hypothetical protein EYG11_18205 [Candidatus Latescibacteria bacterium]|nr:hypothetical protein [Candidatus Handelsmanbacteria bacterium]HIL10636.1 hypothetical protein [Candidatus Latescibacterota bacterium]
MWISWCKRCGRCCRRCDWVIRDYMRDHKDEAQNYAELKERRAKTTTGGMAEYLEGKTL